MIKRELVFALARSFGAQEVDARTGAALADTERVFIFNEDELHDFVRIIDRFARTQPVRPS